MLSPEEYIAELEQEIQLLKTDLNDANEEIAYLRELLDNLDTDFLGR